MINEKVYYIWYENHEQTFRAEFPLYNETFITKFVALYCRHHYAGH